MSAADSSLIRASRVAIVTVGIIGALVAIASSLLFPRPAIPISRVNGRYANAQCGSLSFNNGVVSWDASSATYTLQTDKVGLFALTKNFVGVAAAGTQCHIVSDRSKYPLYLRFDKEAHPATVSLSGEGAPATYDFSR